MRTTQQASGPLGTGGFTHTDDMGVVWTVNTVWHAIGGRAECTALTIDSGGLGRVTSTLVRQVEREVRAEREQRAAKVRRMVRGSLGPRVAQRAARQVATYEAGGSPAAGRPRDDTQWLARAEAMALAWAEGRSMRDALRDLEPGYSDETYRKRIDRTRAWDREHGPGLLDGVGRARREERR